MPVLLGPSNSSQSIPSACSVAVYESVATGVSGERPERQPHVSQPSQAGCHRAR